MGRHSYRTLSRWLNFRFLFRPCLIDLNKVYGRTAGLLLQNDLGLIVCLVYATRSHVTINILFRVYALELIAAGEVAQMPYEGP
jgi:hypothetical protein